MMVTMEKRMIQMSLRVISIWNIKDAKLLSSSYTYSKWGIQNSVWVQGVSQSFRDHWLLLYEQINENYENYVNIKTPELYRVQNKKKKNLGQNGIRTEKIN